VAIWFVYNSQRTKRDSTYGRRGSTVVKTTKDKNWNRDMFGTPINRSKGWGERKNKDSKRNRRDSKKSLRDVCLYNPMK